jgi:hypothetical protein
MSRRALAVCASIGFLVAAAICPAYAAQYDYIAITQGPAAARQGSVRAGGLIWLCTGDRCTISGPWAQPGVGACRELARAVGPLRSYGRGGAQLSSAQMAECNAGVSMPAPVVQVVPQTKPAPLPGDAGTVTPAMKLPQAGLPPGALPTQPMGPGGKPLPVTRAPAPPPEISGPTAMMERSFSAGTRFTTSHGFWACSGNRCVATGLDLRRFFEACPHLSRQAGPVVWFRSREISLKERELALCNSPVVEEFVVTACSGADDFRIGSSLKMSWDAGDGFFPAQGQPLDFIERRISANNCNFARIPRHGIRPFPLIALRKLRFMFEGGRRTFTDAQDDWDMQRILVQVKVARPGDPAINMVILRAEGNPLRRFEDVSHWDVDIPPSVFDR